MLNRVPQESSKGFTLIELMIAILLAAIVIGATMAFLFSSVKSSVENIKMTRMNQELRAVMTFVTDDLKRAGFTMSSASNASEMIEVLDWDSGDSCLMYAYQNDASNASATFNSKSFKRDGALIRYADASQGDTLCEGSALNDPDIVSITNFDAQIVTPGFGGASLAQVTVSLAGETLHRGSVLSDRSISEVVRVRNELPQ